MGNSNNQSINVGSFDHPRLGSVKKVQENNANHYILYEVILENKKIYEEWLKQLQFVQSEEAAQEILFLPIEQQFQQTAYCGTGGILKLKFQDYFYSILPEIENRKNIKRPFNEQQLLYLFYSLIKISALLQAKNRNIRDIKPENILVNEDGYIKVISQISWPSQPMKTSHSWQKTHQRLFLSPQECEERGKKKELSSDNYQSRYSEIYSIGLTILEAGTLKSCSEIYGGPNQYRFNEMKLFQFIDIFQTRYSKPFSQIVKEMLHPVPKRRWRPAYIYEILKAYEYQIMNLEQIQIRLDKSTSIPRIEREEKISIKKIGESYYSHSDYSQKSKLSQQPELSKQTSQRRQREIIMMHSQQNYWSSTSYQNNSMMMNNSNRFNYPAQNVKFHLVNENTNFSRKVPVQTQPVSYIPTAKTNYDQNRQMAISMPLDISDYEHLKKSRPHYITQNSMMPSFNRPLNQSSHTMGSGYYIRE